MRRQYTNELAAIKYMRYLISKGYDARLYTAYSYGEQTTIFTVDVVKEES